MLSKIKIISTIILFILCTSFVQRTFAADEIIEQHFEDANVKDAENKTNTDDIFAPIELDLTDYSYMNKKNKKFILHAEKDAQPSQRKVQNMIWDDSKLYRYNYYSNETNLRALPSYGSLGSSVVQQLDENTSVMIGQDGLDKINGDTINFAYANWSMYSSGARIDSSTKHFNYAVAASTETDTLHNQVAAVVSTKPANILKTNAQISAGTAVFTNLMDEANKNTAGVFTQYKQGKFSLGVQLSQSSYTNGAGSTTQSVHILPRYDINDHLSLKTKLVNNMSIDQIQGEIGLSIKPLKDTDVWSIDVTAANYQSQNVITRQRLKFTTEFRF